jgi:hypothetical protein
MNVTGDFYLSAAAAAGRHCRRCWGTHFCRLLAALGVIVGILLFVCTLSARKRDSLSNLDWNLYSFFWILTRYIPVHTYRTKIEDPEAAKCRKRQKEGSITSHQAPRTHEILK